tara:strand:+ start:264 stop:1556 length:1293 start_codon:yes stop_codon:yes gene_type:complete
MKFIELQNLLKDKLGIEHLADIARELGVTPQAVSNWKSRDRIPYKYVAMVRKKFVDKNNRILNKLNKDTKSSSDKNINSLPNQYFEEYSISISDILLIISKNFKLLIIIPSIFCILTIFYAIYFTRPFYQSSSKIMSSSGSNNNSQALGIAAQFGINLPLNNSEPEWAYNQIITSRTIARQVVNRKFDTERYGNQKSLIQILTYKDKKPSLGADTLEIIAINNFINNMLKVDEDVQSGMYTITTTAAEPKLAANINKALIEELDSHQREYNKSKTSETRKFIEERIFETEKELQNAEEALKNFKDRNRRIENSPALQLEQQRLLREATVLTGVFTTLKQQLETTKIEEVKESEYIVIIDNPEPPLLPTGPKRKMMVIMAGFFGIGIGTILALIKNYFQSNDIEEKEKIREIKVNIISNINYFLPELFKWK